MKSHQSFPTHGGTKKRKGEKNSESVSNRWVGLNHFLNSLPFSKAVTFFPRVLWVTVCVCVCVTAIYLKLGLSVCLQVVSRVCLCVNMTLSVCLSVIFRRGVSIFWYISYEAMTIKISFIFSVFAKQTLAGHRTMKVEKANFCCFFFSDFYMEKFLFWSFFWKFTLIS